MAAKTCKQRLNNIIGQLQGAGKMMTETNRDCLGLLMQLKAARSALSSLMDKIVGEELDRCLLNSGGREKAKIEKIIKEIIKS